MSDSPQRHRAHGGVLGVLCVSAVHSLLFLITGIAEAQQFVVSARAGVMNVTNESYADIYGASTPTIGGAARADLGRRWSVGLSGDFAAKSGELIVFVPEPMPSGVQADLNFQTVNLSFGARLGPVAVIIGPTWLSLSEETEFDRLSLSKYGGHLAVRFERGFGSWLLGGEAGYLHIPETFGPEGAPGVQGDTDFSAVTAHLLVGYRF